MKKIPSFTIDHIRLLRGIYVSRQDQVGNETITTFDIRMKEPNREPALNPPAIHTIEHLAATFLRNHPVWADRILVNGKLVESVLLNGKDFFKGDHTVLLDNLPAYTVRTVKFYDKTSERSEGLKTDLGDGRFVMDVNLKREYQIGWMANAEAGAGTHERWLGRLFALRFTPQSRLALYANANNTHENRKPGTAASQYLSGI